MSQERKHPTDQAVINATDNKYVQDVNGNHLIYKTEFYIAMYKQMKSGKNPVEAYSALGFNVKELGKDRAYACAQRANEMAKDGSFYDYKKLDGSLTKEEMGEMTPEMELAWLRARTIYLERALEVEKKAPAILERSYTLLKEANLKKQNI